MNSLPAKLFNALHAMPHDCEPYVAAARACIDRGDFVIIPTRNDPDEIYLARFWLTPPKIRTDDGRLMSSKSLLLHYFARADDDESLHDHPWNFRTTILTGGYIEHRPPLEWDASGSVGPAWDQRTFNRSVGESLTVAASQLHCVGAVQPNTWTLLLTGTQTREWGFHPPGRAWIQWAKFLGLKE